MSFPNKLFKNQEKQKEEQIEKYKKEVLEEANKIIAVFIEKNYRVVQMLDVVKTIEQHINNLTMQKRAKEIFQVKSDNINKDADKSK